jgi:agmatinase
MLKAGTVPFVLGGDDSVPIPVLNAYGDFANGPISILQIDAHIDWRDEVGGETQGLSSNMRRASEMAHVGSIVQLAARGIGSARKHEVEVALDYGVAFHTMRRLRESGGIERAIADLPEGVPVYVALDVDSLDPTLMPAVIGAAQGGLDYWQMMDIFEAIEARAPICGFNMVELMPSRDVNGQGALMASRLGLSMLGLMARQIASGPA